MSLETCEQCGHLLQQRPPWLPVEDPRFPGALIPDVGGVLPCATCEVGPCLSLVVVHSAARHIPRKLLPDPPKALYRRRTCLQLYGGPEPANPRVRQHGHLDNRWAEIWYDWVGPEFG